MRRAFAMIVCIESFLAIPFSLPTKTVVSSLLFCRMAASVLSTASKRGMKGKHFFAIPVVLISLYLFLTDY